MISTPAGPPPEPPVGEPMKAVTSEAPTRILVSVPLPSASVPVIVVSLKPKVPDSVTNPFTSIDPVT